jgi:hypothetical protein
MKQNPERLVFIGVLAAIITIGDLLWRILEFFFINLPEAKVLFLYVVLITNEIYSIVSSLL